MSSRSAGNAAPAADWPTIPTSAVNTAPIRIAALFMLCLFGFFGQLDAVANRLSGGSPVSLLEIIIGGLGAAVLLAVAIGREAPAQAIGSVGIRLVLLVPLWGVVCWTLSAHQSEGLKYLGHFSTAVLPACTVFLIVDKPWKIHAVLWAMIAAAGVSAAIVIIEAKTGTRLVATALAAVSADFDGVARSSGGSDQNPTTAAQMLMVGVVLAMGLLFAGEKRGRIMFAGVLLVGSAALALMSARSAIMGLGVGGGLVLLGFRSRSYFPAIVAGAVIIGAAAILFAPPTLIERFAAIGDFGKDQTLYRRITYIRIGADLIGGSPIWGVGPGNFPLHYIEDAYRYMPGRELYPRELHNTYVDVATEYGLVGFAIFAALIVTALKAARRGFEKGASALLATASYAVAITLAALLVACFFMPHKDLRYLWLLFALAIQCGRLRAGEEAQA
ncbi:MAG: O-antigen ligase family protein [Pseudomonadota bacterium]|uniref:O-antigen ligase family protein n=1 Tax=Sphingomonas sp. ERG5 TaxID=1381597 RepID=UPI00054C5C93|nr:O-antigen ligase family protein [Sphingomonas sp. ERG5]